MSTEPRRVTKPADWTVWENQVVNGLYRLRRFLSASRHSVVFLSEYDAKQPFDVAIKLVPADPLRADAQVAQWEKAATLSHPHLLRVFDVGRCQLGGRSFVFVVMEHAEQTLAQILARRALTADEVREMLPPALEALSFLHNNDLVHGHLKPSNILAVGDQLKLSSDTVRATGPAPSGVVRTSLYDPPELTQGTISTAGDIWAFGMTLVEALSQRTWKGARGQGETTTSLLASLPEPFQETARRCLSRSAAGRPTVADLITQYGRPPQDELVSVEVISTPQPPQSEDVIVSDASSAAEPQAPTEMQTANEAPEEAGAQTLSLANLSFRAIVLALVLFFSAWAVLRS
jgi:serine/threonine protein kinase